MGKLSAWSITAVFLALALCGCGTLVSKLGDEGLGRPYDGIEIAIESIKCGGPFTLFGFIDFPLSLIADTLMLPFDLLTERKRERYASGCLSHI